mgnify:CR=1 FL=1
MGWVRLRLTGILDIEGYHTVNLEILAGYADQVPDLRVTVDMGKITGSTLADEVDRFTIAILIHIHIHTYPVIGPELVVWVLGAPKHRRRYPGLGLSQLSAQVVAVSRSIPTSSARSVRSFSQPISSSAKVRLSG